MHDGGEASAQQPSDVAFPPFFMDAFDPLHSYDGTDTSGDTTSWWPRADSGQESSQTIMGDIAWPSAFQRVLDSMAMDQDSGSLPL